MGSDDFECSVMTKLRHFRVLRVNDSLAHHSSMRRPTITLIHNSTSRQSREQYHQQPRWQQACARHPGCAVSEFFRPIPCAKVDFRTCSCLSTPITCLRHCC